MKKKYCKICGLELEKNVCSSGNHTIKEKKEKKQCSSCKKLIDEDSKYCPYCGIPTFGIEDDGALKEELKGNFAEDVIEHYHIRKKKGKNKNIPIILFGIVIILGISLYVVKNTNFLQKSSIDMLGEDVDDDVEEDVDEIDGISDIDDKEKLEEKYNKKESIYKEEVKETERKEVTDTSIIEPTTKEDDKNYVSDTVAPTAGNEKFSKDLPNGGTIKNIDTKKEFYIDDLIEIVDVRKIENKDCETTYYLPVLKGKDSNLVNQINEDLKVAFYGELKNVINSYIDTLDKIPKEVFIDTVELRTVNNKQLNFLLNGTVTPYEGLYEKCKFRILYKRATRTFEIRNTTE